MAAFRPKSSEVLVGEFDHRRVWGPKPNYPHVKAWTRASGGVLWLYTPLIVLAGPCSVEDGMDLEFIAGMLKRSGATKARGGLYRAGTYPGPNFGYKQVLAGKWSRACKKVGLGIVVEVLDIRLLDRVDEVADSFQVGARHMQDYALLKELSRSRKTVFLKRNPGSTLDEFLGAAEYLARGSCRPVLIERGSATRMNHVRWDLSISLIAAVKRMTGIPILVDASHGTGRRDLVRPMTMAGIAAGADGFLVEVHPRPERSLSDADQAYPLNSLAMLVNDANSVREAVT